MRRETDQGEDRQNNIPEEIKLNNGQSSEVERSANAHKIMEEIQSLRKSVEDLKEGIEEPFGIGKEEPKPVDRIVKVVKDAEEGRVSQPGSPEDSFAAKYAEQMKQQIERTGQRESRKAERNSQKEAARREKERQKALRAQKRADQRRKRQEEDEARRRERKERARELQKKREIRAEVKRKKKLAHKTAQIGGGVVNLHDTQISTEVKPVAKYSISELLGITPRQRIKAAETEEEIQNIKEEHEAIVEDARMAASHLQRVRVSRFRNSAFGRFTLMVRSGAERHKKMLLFGLSLVILISVGMAGFFNYYTLYEYSYNGHKLGYVKNKDDVLRITDMVQKTLTADKDIQVVIDEKEDISFRRVSSIDKEIMPDSSDQVLKRLTYMGDLNVKAWGIYVNSRKIGSVQKKADAADVLKKLETRYTSDKEGSVVEKAEIQENVEFKRSNTDLRNVLSTDEMVDVLCASRDKESLHTIIAGETIKDIASEYQTTAKALERDNRGMDPNNLTVGDTLIIKQQAPPVTVRLTEKRTYDQKIKYETEEKKTDEMYEGEEEIEQEGENGKEEITERSVSINGEVDEANIEVLDRKVKKEAVKKIILIGTAERPPSVGDGVYIWPLDGGYRLSSGFGRRWGRLHAGIDLATPQGNDVKAADGGIVVRSGYFGGYGLCVDIDHQNGQSTRYGHLSSTLVNVGDEVYEGQHIAESGNTGFSTGAHLHFEIHIGGSPQNPMNYLP